MRERKFLKQLNSKSNKEGLFTYELVQKLINLSDNKPVSNNMFNRLRSKLFKNKSCEEIISDNFQTILSKINGDYKNSLIELLMDYDNLKNIIKEKFPYIMENLSHENPESIKKFLIELKNNNELSKQFIIEYNIEDMFLDFSPAHLFEATNIIKGISEDIDNKLNEQLENKKSGIMLYILEKSTEYRPTDIEDSNREDVIQNYVDTLEIMVDELLNSEGKRMIDINEIGCGSYSNVYEIGDKVLKVGGKRKTYNIPNHKRILQPLTRTNLFDEAEEKIFGCIEIADKVEINPNRDEDDSDDEILYSIYKELRDDGIIWIDIRPANIGKLKRPNIPTLNQEEKYVAPNSVGFDKELKGEVLDSDQWVIIDTDYIYSAEDPNVIWPGTSKKFEKRYQQEQQEKIAEKYKNKDKIIENKEKNSIEEK